MSQNLIFERNEKVEAIVAAEITFYLTRFDESTKEGLINAYNLVLEYIRLYVRWYRAETMKREKKITEEVLKAFPTWFSHRAPQRLEYGLTLTSGQTAEDVGPWGFRFYLEPNSIYAIAGFFQINLPAEILVNDKENFLSLVKGIAKVLPFRSGHAGYGIQYDEGLIIRERDQQQRAWCMRYMGLDCRNLAVTSLQMVNYIKGINWLTLLDYAFCEQLGGVDSIREKLGNDIILEELRYGILIQAGPDPKLGDHNIKEDMSLYQRVNQVVRPLRTPEHLRLPGFDKTETMEWLERFDEP